MEKNERIIKASFPLLEMGCNACAEKIEKVLNEQEGVVKAVVDFPASAAEIEYDYQIVSPELLRDAVRGAGYDMKIEITD